MWGGEGREGKGALSQLPLPTCSPCWYGKDPSPFRASVSLLSRRLGAGQICQPLCGPFRGVLGAAERPDQGTSRPAGLQEWAVLCLDVPTWAAVSRGVWQRRGLGVLLDGRGLGKHCVPGGRGCFTGCPGDLGCPSVPTELWWEGEGESQRQRGCPFLPQPLSMGAPWPFSRPCVQVLPGVGTDSAPSGKGSPARVATAPSEEAAHGALVSCG